MIDPSREIESTHMPTPTKSPKPIRSILVANRGEILIKVMRAADELGTRQNRNLQGTRARTRKYR